MKLAVLQNVVAPTRHALFRALAERADLTVLFMARNEPTRDWGVEQPEGYRHEYLPGFHIGLRARGDVDALHVNPGVAAALRAGRFDALLCAGFLSPTTWLALMAARRTGTRFLLWFGSSWPPSGIRSTLASPLKRAIVSASDRIVAYGELARVQAEALGARRDNVTVALNTTDVTPFAEAPRKAAGQPTVLWVGRFVPRKRADLAVSLVARVAAEVPELRAVFVGDGPERAVTEIVARRAGIAAEFAGDRRYEHLPAVYAEADLLVLRSEREPWGLVVNEALAAGVPVLASTGVVAARELVPAGAGLVSDDESELASVARRLLGDPAELARAREAARAVLPRILPEAWADSVIAAATEAVRSAA
jgi:glycosyltransferase involved in cell wall biosynthesis